MSVRVTGREEHIEAFTGSGVEAFRAEYQQPISTVIRQTHRLRRNQPARTRNVNTGGITVPVPGVRNPTNRTARPSGGQPCKLPRPVKRPRLRHTIGQHRTGEVPHPVIRIRSSTTRIRDSNQLTSIIKRRPRSYPSNSPGSDIPRSIISIRSNTAPLAIEMTRFPAS